MIISIIVAVDNNLCIGKGNEIPWHLPADLKYFKEVSTPHHVIMGRKCFESIPEKFRPLPNRTNVILTHKEGYQAKGATVTHSLTQALKMAKGNKESEVFIIGGGEIYNLGIEMADKLYITRVHTTVEDGEIFFPKFNHSEWDLHSNKPMLKDENNEFDYTFEVWHRKY